MRRIRSRYRAANAEGIRGIRFEEMKEIRVFVGKKILKVIDEEKKEWGHKTRSATVRSILEDWIRHYREKK